MGVLDHDERGEMLRPAATPGPDCPLCPRLVSYRATNRQDNPSWFNAPVPSLGPMGVRLLIVGMAPGVRGANRTGRPFTGDHAGILLYETLLKLGLASGTYAARPDDGMVLVGCRVTNAVRCVPPANLPQPIEVRTCNQYLSGELRALPNLRAVLALGVLSHAAVLRACGLVPSRVKFQHGAIHDLPDGLILGDSYHVSRYNTNTGLLTTEMFELAVLRLMERIGLR